MTWSTTSWWLVCAFAATTTACGPDVTPGSGTGGESASSGIVATETTSSAGESSSSSAPVDCTEVVDGNLDVTDASDLNSLRGVREVTGNVLVRGLTQAEDLSMLACLEVAGEGLSIQMTESVRTLAGLERLREIGDWPGQILVEGNQALETLGGLEGLEEIPRLTVFDNPSLARLDVNHAKRIGTVTLGFVECIQPPAVQSGGDNPLLTEIDGFDALETGAEFNVNGQSGLASLAHLSEVAERIKDGNASGEQVDASFLMNPALPMAEIAGFFAVQEESPPYDPERVCGNADDPNICECQGGV